MGIRSTSAASLSAALLVAVPLAVSGCSQPAPPPPDLAAIDKVAWAGELCGLVGRFAESQQGPGVDKSSAVAFKKSSVAQLANAERAAGTAIDGLRELPPSPIRDGDRVTDVFEQGFGQVQQVLRGAKGKAEQIDPANQQTLAAGMTAVQQELQKGQGIQFDAEFAEFDKNRELNDAARRAPKCQQLMTPPAPQGQPPAPR